MLKKIRVIIAVIFFVFITLLFLDFTGTLHHWFGWLAKIQFFPAFLAVNIGIMVGLILLTFVFGRIYCSVICPLGVFQDGISWLAGKTRKNRFSYSPAISWLRYGMLGIFIIALFTHISLLASILEPYSAYGRIASNLFAPLYRCGNNLFAWFAERAGSYAFYSVDVWLPSLTVLGIAITTFVVIFVLAWRNGRTYCNTVCPVGTILGLISRFSIFKPVFVEEKCNRCGLCARNCKASCIDAKNRKIDYSRCVTCMNCIEKCNKNAMQYLPRPVTNKKPGINPQETVQKIEKSENGISRRSFISLSALFTASGILKAQQQAADGGLAFIEDKKKPDRKTPVMPPGARSNRNLNIHCTACQLCISACPNQILYPSDKLSCLMQPEISYERGYCRPECTRCSEVCPTGAIKRITTAEKSATQIGHAVWIKENCVVLRDEVQCRSCERHCPVGAIILVARDPNDPDALKIPAIDTERCIGCGACENFCPARPFSAIYVEGHTVHRIV